MTPEQLTKKRIWFIVLIAYFLVGYFACGHFNMNRSHYFDVGLSFENNIPFMPAFILGYTSVYIALLFIYILIDDYAVFSRAVRLFLIVPTVFYILFLVIPVKMVRPDLTATDGIMNRMTYYYYLIDNPVNCFPSLHVAYPMLGAIVLWNYKRRWAYLLAVLTVVISVSVILVKQHYIMDVVGAVITTLLISLPVLFYTPRR